MPSRSTDCEVPFSPHATWQFFISTVFCNLWSITVESWVLLRQQSEKSRGAAAKPRNSTQGDPSAGNADQSTPKAAPRHTFTRTPNANERKRQVQNLVYQKGCPTRPSAGNVMSSHDPVAGHPHHSNSHRTPRRRHRLWAGSCAAGASEALRRQATVVLYPHKCHQRFFVGVSFRHGGNVRDDLTKSCNPGDQIQLHKSLTW